MVRTVQECRTSASRRVLSIFDCFVGAVSVHVRTECDYRSGKVNVNNNAFSHPTES